MKKLIVLLMLLSSTSAMAAGTIVLDQSGTQPGSDGGLLMSLPDSSARSYTEFLKFTRRIIYTNVDPGAGSLTWAVGDRAINTSPSELGTAGSKYIINGWICTVAGTPGTWLEMRTLTGN